MTRIRTFLKNRRSDLMSRLYRDAGGGVEDCIVLTGMGRSGTTWVAETICSQIRCRQIFEPFYAEAVPEAAPFALHQYLRPGAEEPVFQAFFQQIAEGRIRNPWVDRYVDHLRPNRRLVKAVRASLLLRWIHTHFPAIPLLLVVRNPCANVASYLRLEWPSDQDVRSIFGQPDLVEDHLEEFLPLVRRARRPHQSHAVLWCVLNLVPLRQFRSGGLHVFHYEDLLDRPRAWVPKLFDAIGARFDESVYRRMQRASRTTMGRARASPPRTRRGGWREELGPARVDEVLEIVEAFGLGGLYDGDGNPTGRLHGEGSGGVTRAS